MPLRSANDKILSACARDPGRSDAALESLLGDPVDWPNLLRSGRLHGLLPILYDRLQLFGERLVPRSVLAELRAVYYTSLFRNERLRDELSIVIAHLEERGLRSIVLKGAALSGTVYRSPAFRPMCDLDILVRPDDVAGVGEALDEIGFRLSGSVPPQAVSFHQRFGGGVAWVREHGRGQTHLDVHHHLVGVDWLRPAIAIDYEALWAAARPLQVGETRALQLSIEDLLIHLCLHPAIQHGYAWPLIGLVDIDKTLSRAGDGFPWEGLIRRASRFKARSAVWLGLSCAHNLLGAPVPPDVLGHIDPGTLRKAVMTRLAPSDGTSILTYDGRRRGGVGQALLYAWLIERPLDMARVVRRVLFPCREWLSLRYSLESDRDVVVSRVAHPFRVARAAARGLSRPLLESSLD